MLLLLACNGAPQGLAPTPAGEGPVVVVDFDAGPIPELPLPNDLWLRADPTSVTGVRLNVPVAQGADVQARAALAANQLDGWSLTGPISVSLSAPVTVEPGDVVLVDVDPDSPDRGRSVPLDVDGRFPLDPVSDVDPLDVTGLWLRPLEPLRPRTTYAVVLTTSLTDDAGQSVRSPWAWVNHTDQTGALEDLPELGVPLESIAFAWSFTTGRGGADLEALVAGRYELPEPALEGDQATVPELRDADGVWQVDPWRRTVQVDAGAVTVVCAGSGPVALAVPEPGNDAQTLVDDWSAALDSLGWSVCAFDPPGVGARAVDTDNDGTPDAATQLVHTDGAVARDWARQGALEIVWVADALDARALIGSDAAATQILLAQDHLTLDAVVARSPVDFADAVARSAVWTPTLDTPRAWIEDGRVWLDAGVVLDLGDAAGATEVEIENGETGGVRRAEGSVSIPADARSAAEKRAVTGMPETGAGEGLWQVQDTTLLGDPLTVRVFDDQGEIGVFDTFPESVVVDGVTCAAGATLVALQPGLGLDSSDAVRRWVWLQTVLRGAASPHGTLQSNPLLLVAIPGDPAWPTAGTVGVARAQGWLSESTDQLLLDQGVLLGLPGDGVLYDADDLDQGQDECPTGDAPLLESVGDAHLRLPMVDPVGAHVLTTDPVDWPSYLVWQGAAFIATGELVDDLCLEDGSCW
jgi:hypothetical protein